MVDRAGVAFTLMTFGVGEDMRDQLGKPIVMVFHGAEQKLRSACHNFRELWSEARHGEQAQSMQWNGQSQFKWKTNSGML